MTYKNNLTITDQPLASGSQLEKLPAWGKYDIKTSTFHRLEYHCADVAACFEELLQDPVLLNRFEQAAGVGEFSSVTKARLAVIAFLHDFAKLNTGFQFKVDGRRQLCPDPPHKMGHISEAFFCFHHSEIIEAIGLREIANSWGEEGFVPLLYAALSHHGRPAKAPNSGSGFPDIWQPYCGYNPLEAATLINCRIHNWFPEAFKRGKPLSASPALAHLFAGTVALADQIGSDREYFKFESDLDENYIERARQIARKVINARGLSRFGRPGRAKPATFQEIWDYPNPRPLQQAVMDASLDHPLLILESETGSGKTEAAVMRFAALWRVGLVDGLYFALPTRAAAKQIHRRINTALERLFPPEPWAKTVRAIPGYPFIGEAPGKPVGDYKVYWEDNPDEATRAARWSAESARHFLSSTSAVGTIDQVLLAGLMTKWAHLRGASLARSLLVVDEVHASDAYMTALLRSVLQGHLDLGGHALLLSATLGSVARSELCSRSARFDLLVPNEAVKVPYPALILAGNSLESICPIDSTGNEKKVSMRIEQCLSNPKRIAELACSQAKEGAKVLVLRNTVGTAQAVFNELLNLGFSELSLTVEGIPTLHHSRFAVEDRELLDAAVEEALGKQREPSDGCVVIGTQTLEQSLDIDADILITDLCPIDVLLQRIGRLHRHADLFRPKLFDAPQCIVIVPEEGLENGLSGGFLRYGLGMNINGGGVYRNLLVLEKTQLLIKEHSDWIIPKMNRMLVEQATHPQLLQQRAEVLGGQWIIQYQKNWGIGAAERQLAKSHALDRTRPFDDELAFPDLDEKVRTRLGEDGPRVKLSKAVCGPFGKEVKTFNLPVHLFKSADSIPTKSEIEEAWAEKQENGLVLNIGNHILLYDQTGIHL